MVPVMSNSIVRKDMNDEEWITPRLFYLKSFVKPQRTTCPECHGEIEYSTEDEDEAYCTRCGLVTSASIRYVAGNKIDLPYGIRL